MLIQKNWILYSGSPAVQSLSAKFSSCASTPSSGSTSQEYITFKGYVYFNPTLVQPAGASVTTNSATEIF